jgi:hypothetical protein
MYCKKNTPSQTRREKRDWKTKDDMVKWCELRTGERNCKRHARNENEWKKLLRKARAYLGLWSQ